MQNRTQYADMLSDGWEYAWVGCELAENADKQVGTVAHSGRGTGWDTGAMLFPFLSLPWELCSLNEQPRAMKRELEFHCCPCIVITFQANPSQENDIISPK